MCRILLALLMSACTGPTKLPLGGRDTAALAFDEDGDGYAAGEDCNDEDPSIYPGGLERCDGIDNNCDGVADEGVLDTVFPDDDGDGFGDGGRGEEACGPGDGYVTNGNDCDDAAADVWPGAPEVCDLLDNDCDGEVDDGSGFLAFTDGDGDGFGDAAAGQWVCALTEGLAEQDGDCDDTAGTVFPGAPEDCNTVDDDCDGLVDEGVTLTFFLDVDGDTWGDGAAPVEACARPDGHAARAGDCNDADFDYFPGAPEEDCADPNDYNCDGSVAFADVDGDGFAACRECDDGDALVFPGASEVCNGVDDDCDGGTDDADAGVDLSTASLWHTDADGDGFGDPSTAVVSCDPPPAGVADGTDCDDLVDTTFPGADEDCNGADDDCDGLTDDDDPGVDLSTGTVYYPDGDGDGFGVPSGALRSCARPLGYAALSTDCNDASGSVFPGAFEVCNLVDDDCDSLTDDADPGVDLSTGTVFYRDADNDGHGDPSSTVRACSLPTGYRTSADDCNDAAATVRPGATEVCNGIDDDCDAASDDADAGLDTSTASIWYPDADRDGYGSMASSVRACVAPSGHLGSASDCNDALAAVNPGGSEVCNSLDDDCDGLIDDADGSRTGGTTWYRDADGDGYGVTTTTTTACSRPSGYAALAGDCNDASASVRPAGTEACNGVDDDCDGSTDEGMPDSDSDGLCDARDTEACDGLDNDGDGLGDEGLTCSYRIVRSDLTNGLCVDDDLDIYRNSTLIFADRNVYADCHAAFSFTATPGDTLTFYAYDSYGGCRSIDDVWIVNVASGRSRRLATGFSGSCGHGASWTPFWTRSVAVPGIF
jgi:hypothetical protein